MICYTCGTRYELEPNCDCKEHEEYERESALRAGDDSSASPGYAVHIDCKSGEIDPATMAAIDKMAALLHKRELIRARNAAVNKDGVIVDKTQNPNAVPLPPHNAPISHAVSDDAND